MARRARSGVEQRPRAEVRLLKPETERPRRRRDDGRFRSEPIGIALGAILSFLLALSCAYLIALAAGLRVPLPL